MARLTKELNTSLEATFKDGSKKQFNSIEEASELTNISIAAIKIRANKPGTGGKDGTLFKWLDDHTRKSFLARKSRNKGHQTELDIIKDLNNIGYNCKSTRSESRQMDNNKVDIFDLSGNLPTYIQVKNTINTPNYYKIQSECPLTDKPFSIIWKKSNMINCKLAIIDYDFFLELLKKYSNEKIDK